MTGFVERCSLWSDDQRRAAVEVARQAKTLGVVRLSFPDQHGVLHGKTIVAAELDGAFRNGVTSPSSLLAKDTSHRTVFPVFTRGGGFDMPEMEGAADLLLVPDPQTFKVLPWAPHSGWLLCDLHFADGRAVPFGTRQLFRRVLDDLNQRGLDYIAGLEVECHIFKLHDRDLAASDAGQPGIAPEISLLTTGYQLLNEERYDRYDEVFEILRGPIEALGLPLRSLEVEFGPSQVEFTFRPGSNLEPADTMVLFRSAAKQICRRHGYHASFMCRPRLANIFSSGWHLHQNLRSHKSGANAFVPEEAAEPLSPLGRHFLAGLLRHARASAAFATPTINGYRRYRPYTLAPDRAIWGRDNRGVMVRVLGGPGDPATRLENRIGEPAANPYLYMASQIALGLDGIDGALVPVRQPTPLTRPPLPPYRDLSARRSSLCGRALRCATPSAPASSTISSASKRPNWRASSRRSASGSIGNISIYFSFAVFLTNPAPVCVLDEVDAPLDDANVDRFCSLVGEIADTTGTRFLMVTHHRITMARVDCLFGVTMAERGVSQLVSVDLAARLRQTG